MCHALLGRRSRRCGGVVLMLLLVACVAVLLITTHRLAHAGAAAGADLLAPAAGLASRADVDAEATAPPALSAADLIPAHVFRRDGVRACTLPGRGGSERLACALLHFQHTVQSPFLRRHFPELLLNTSAAADADAADDVYVTHDGRALDCSRYASPIAGAPVATSGSFVRSSDGAKRRFFVQRKRPKWLAFQAKHGGGGLADRMLGVIMALQLALITNRALIIDHALPAPLTVALAPNALRWPDRLPSTTAGTVVEVMHWVNNPHAGDLVARAADWYRDAEGLIFRGNTNFFTELPEAYKRAYGLDPAHHLDSYWGCFFSYLFAPTQAVQSRILGAGLPLLPARPFASQLATPPYLARALEAERPIVCAQLRMGGRQPSFNDSWVINDPRTFPWPLVYRWLDAAFDATDARVLFVASDSDEVIGALETHYHAPGSDKRVVTIPGDVLHVDRSTLQGKSAAALAEDFQKVVADNYALGTCARVLITWSGFGRIGVWRTAVPYAAVDMQLDGHIDPLRLHAFNDGTLGSPHPSLP